MQVFAVEEVVQGGVHLHLDLVHEHVSARAVEVEVAAVARAEVDLLDVEGAHDSRLVGEGAGFDTTGGVHDGDVYLHHFGNGGQGVAGNQPVKGRTKPVEVENAADARVSGHQGRDGAVSEATDSVVETADGSALYESPEFPVGEPSPGDLKFVILDGCEWVQFQRGLDEGRQFFQQNRVHELVGILLLCSHCEGYQSKEKKSGRKHTGR